MKARRFTISIIIFVISGFILTGCQKPSRIFGGKAGDVSTPEKKSRQVKAAFVYTGQVGNAGWTYSHDIARRKLEEELPFVKTSGIESVTNADSARVFAEYASKGYDIIFGTGFDYMDAMMKVANEYPGTRFEHCAGYKTARNMGTYFGKMYEARYLTGIVAGKMTRTNIIGYVAAYPIPEVIRGINAFTQGALSVNPDVRVKVVWIYSWNDPAKERESALSLIDRHADVIAQHQDTPAPQQAAEERGKYSIGYNTDMSSFAPRAHLTSAVWNWYPYYERRIRQVKDGSWKPEKYWGGIKDGIVDIAPFGPMVPQDVRELVNEKRKQIVEGNLDIFKPPLRNQRGELQVIEGDILGDDDLLNMDWFVEGVEGVIPIRPRKR
ncbi:MAG: BMP family ABC transporter substrate-binding protein [Candidatus Eremiobacteraeota bacterium]|nr:BMP family ABC transporter substrate-binding protein [Candidatus Eremiobacteraeota bacterium]